MQDVTPVEQFLADENVIDLAAEIPDRHVKPHLLEPLKDWLLAQGIATRVKGEAWREHLAAELSERGKEMCLSLQIRAVKVRDLDELIQERPDLLLRLLDWLTRKIAEQAALKLMAAKSRATVAKVDLSLAQPSPEEVERERRWIARLEEDVAELEKQKMPPAIRRLEWLLSQGRSGWRAEIEPPGLVERVSPEERAEYDSAKKPDDIAAAHLRAAWQAAWGVDHDGQKAFDEAVKALEAAFRPVAAPKDPGATLGKIARYLDDKPDKWRARLADARPPSSSGKGDDAGAQALADLLHAIIAANRRHAADGTRLQNSLDDGRDAVSLAVALVAMQRRGFIQHDDAPVAPELD